MIQKLSNRILWCVLGLLATGTIADQVTRAFTTSANVVLVVWLGISLLAVLIARTFAHDRLKLPKEIAPDRQTYFRAAIVAAASAFCAYVLNDARQSTVLFQSAEVVAVVIALGGMFVAWRSQSLSRDVNRLAELPSDKSSVSPTVLTLCMAVAAGMADITYRASTDDHYYVNLSTYIYDNGVIPTHDTVLSNQYFNSYKRFSSWEVLWGLISRVMHVHPAYLLYLLVLPLAAALSIFVYARVIATCGITRPNIALIAITTFLIFDGAQGFTFGSFQGPRIWQGKSFFLAIVLPLLFVQIIRVLNVDRNTAIRNRELAQLLLLVIAALGASTTAFIIVIPLLAVAFVLAVALRHQSAQATFALAATYLLVTGYIFKTMRQSTPTAHTTLGTGVGVQSADYSTNSPMPQTYDLLTKLTNPGWHGALIAVAICLGWLGLHTRFAKALVALSASAFGFICVPGFLEWFLTLTGSRAVAWRYIWLIPIPLLVGSVAAVLYDTSASLLRHSTPRRFAYIAPGVWVIALALLPMTLGTPPWQVAPKSKQVAEIAKPFSLRLGYGYVQAKKALDLIAQDYDVVLARNGISSSINVMTTKFYTVSPRPSYVNLAVKGFADGNAQQRNKLGIYITGDEPVEFAQGELAQALDAVRVNVVCLTSDREVEIPVFTALGYDAATKKVTRKDGKLWVWCGRTSAYDVSTS